MLQIFPEDGNDSGWSTELETLHEGTEENGTGIKWNTWNAKVCEIVAYDMSQNTMQTYHVCYIGYECNGTFPFASASSFIDYLSLDSSSGSSTDTVDISGISDTEVQMATENEVTVCMQSAVAYGILGTSDGDSRPSHSSDVDIFSE